MTTRGKLHYYEPMPTKVNSTGDGGRIGLHCIRTLFVVLLFSLIVLVSPPPAGAQIPVIPEILSESANTHTWISGKIIDSLLSINYYLLDTKTTLEAGTTITTGPNGQTNPTLTKGVYELKAVAPSGTDLTIPQYVTVTTQTGKTPILIGQSVGRGRVFAYQNNSTSGTILSRTKKLFAKLGVPTRRTLSLKAGQQVLGFFDEAPPPGSQTEVVLQVFADANKNGRQEETEPLLNSPGVELNLTKKDNAIVYSLLNGWNLVHFPLAPTTFSTAKELIAEIAREGGYVTTVATWKDGQWLEYVQRGNDIYSADFPIEPGVAYFLRSHRTMDWLVTGNPVDPTPVKLIPGWNSLGLFLSKGQTAEDVLDAINQSQDGQTTEIVNEIDRWLSGNWQVFVKRLYRQENLRNYGDNFVINPEEGYMIKSTDFINLTLENQE